MKGGVGATMMPYTVFFLIFWTILQYIRMVVGLLLGPGDPLRL